MARKPSRPHTGHAILVVDDQEETLASVRQLLEREGHTVFTAESGAKALALYKENEIHLLLVDYFMPRMNGEQLVREIRRVDPYVQIILQTGYSGQKPPRVMLRELDIQGYHDKADGPDRLLLWVDVGLNVYRMIHKIRERERLQHELVSNVSHEFRTPLNIISGYTDLLRDQAFGPLDSDVLRILQRVAQATLNLGELVEDFLKYAKVEAGVTTVSKSAMVMCDLVAEMERYGAQLIDGKSVRFSVGAWEGPDLVVVDGVKLKTVLRNLLSNAIKFTREGSVSLQLAVREGDLEVVVSDTGPGMRSEDLQLIFQPFRQLDGSDTRAYGGIGLGLALSHRLARLMGGSIEVTSEVGVGSTFVLRVPSAVAGVHPPQAVESAAGEPLPLAAAR